MIKNELIVFSYRLIIIYTITVLLFDSAARAGLCSNLFRSPTTQLVETERSSAIYIGGSVIFDLPMRLLIYQGFTLPPKLEVERYEVSDLFSPATKKSTQAPLLGLSTIMNELYKSFLNQGPERSSLLQRIKQQDKDEKARIVHFFAYDYRNKGLSEYLFEEIAPELLQGNLRPWIHLQLLLSNNHTKLLHIEEEISIKRLYDGEVLAEVGRLDLSRTVRELVTTEELDREDLKFVKIRILHELTTWLRQHAEVNRIFFQVNAAVLRVLSSTGLPVHVAKKTSFRKAYIQNGEPSEVEEFVLELNRDQIKLWDQNITQQLWINHISFFLSINSQNKMLKLTLTKAEVFSLIELGLVELTTPEKSSVWTISKKNKETSDHYQMRALPVNYRPMDVNSKAFERLKRTDPIYMSYLFDFSFGGMAHLKRGEVNSKTPLFAIDKNRFQNAQYVSFYIPVDSAREIHNRLTPSGRP